MGQKYTSIARTPGRKHMLSNFASGPGYSRRMLASQSERPTNGGLRFRSVGVWSLGFRGLGFRDELDAPHGSNISDVRILRIIGTSIP